MDTHQNSVSPTEDQTDPVQTNQSEPLQTDANTNPAEPTSSSQSDAKSSPETSLSSVVEKALKDGKEGTSPSVTKPQVDPKSKVDVDPKAAQAKVEPNAEEIPKEFHKHPAWVRLKTQRDEAKAEMARYKTSADEFGIVTGYMEENNIPVDDVVEALHMLALKNSDPVAFLEAITDFKNQFDEEMGLVLSPELKARVESGEISEEDAKALQRSSAEARLYKDREAERVQKTRDEKALDEQRQVATQMVNAVNAWQKSIQLKDPDYAVKHDLVEAKIRAFIQTHGAPKTPQDALKYAETAYEQVTKTLNGIMPKRRPNTPTPQTGRQVETQFAPKSLTDVVSNILLGNS